MSHEPSPSAVTFNIPAYDLSNNLRIGKSTSLLRELTSSWSSEPVCVKYSLKDECDSVDDVNRVPRDADDETTVANRRNAHTQLRRTKAVASSDGGAGGPTEPVDESKSHVSNGINNGSAATSAVSATAENSSPLSGFSALFAFLPSSSSSSPKSVRGAHETKRRMYGRLSVDETWLRKRAQLLRQCVEHLELESVGSRYTKETFRRAFMNKVGVFRIIK